MSRVRRAPLENLAAALALVRVVAVLGDHVFFERRLRVEDFLTDAAADLFAGSGLADAATVSLVHHVRALVAVRLPAYTLERRHGLVLAHVTFIADLLEEALAADVARVDQGDLLVALHLLHAALAHVDLGVRV